MRRRWLYSPILLLFLLLLGGCLLIAGERVTDHPLQPGAIGEHRVEFVSADGEARRELLIGVPSVPVVLDVTLAAEWGELTLDILDSDLSTVATVSARYKLAAHATTVVETDGAGRVHFRLRATEARNGSYVIRYHLQESPTPTPTPTPTLAPSP